MNCEHSQTLLIDYLYGEVDDGARLEVEAALAECAACREELAALRRTHAALDELPALEVPARLHADLLRAARLHAAERAPRRSPFAALFAGPAFALAASAVLVTGGAFLVVQLSSGDARQEADMAATASALSEPEETVARNEGVPQAAPTGTVLVPEERAAAPEPEPGLDFAAQEQQQGVALRGAGGLGAGAATPAAEDGDSANDELAVGELGGALGRTRGGAASGSAGAGRRSTDALEDSLGGIANVAEPTPARDAREQARSAREESYGDRDDLAMAAPEQAESERPAEPVAALAPGGPPTTVAPPPDPSSSAPVVPAPSAPAPRGGAGLGGDGDRHTPSAEATVAESRSVAATPRRAGSGAPPSEAAAGSVDSEADGYFAETPRDEGIAALGVDATWTEALGYYDGGDFRQAASRFDAFVAAADSGDARMPEALYYAATANLRIGRADAARYMLQRFLDGFPGHRLAADARVLLEQIARDAEREAEPLRQRSESPSSLEE